MCVNYATGFLHRVCRWVVVLTAAAFGLCRVTESHCTILTVHMTYVAALRTTTHLQTRCRKPCAATSNAPDDGRTRPKHVELRIHQ